MKKLTEFQEKQVLNMVRDGVLPLVGVYLGSRIEHVEWPAREAVGTTPGRAAGSMTFAVHTIVSGDAGSVKAHSVRVRMPSTVDHDKANAAEWTNGASKTPLPALPVNSAVVCAMAAFWTEKGAMNEEAAEIVELKETAAK